MLTLSVGDAAPRCNAHVVSERISRDDLRAPVHDRPSVSEVGDAAPANTDPGKLSILTFW